MRISDWSSDVCSSDLLGRLRPRVGQRKVAGAAEPKLGTLSEARIEENPAPPAIIDRLVKAATVGITAIRLQLRYLHCRQSVPRSRQVCLLATLWARLWDLFSATR